MRRSPLAGSVLLAVLVILAAGCTTPGSPGTTPDAATTPGGAAADASPSAGTAVATADVAGVADEILGPGSTKGISGTYYTDLDLGDGPEVRRCDLVFVHYVDALPDGKVLADTRKAGQVFMFADGARPGQVIPGWEAAVTGMKVGGHRKAVIPPEIAYAEKGVAGLIPPNSPMVWDVELLDAKSPMPLPKAPADVIKYERTASGLEYATIQPGTGPVATAKQWAHVHFTGWLPDGTMFDTTLDDKHCGPFLFPLGVGQVLKGWDEGIVGMKVGEVRQMRLSPALAFGAEGSGKVPPNTTVTFQIALMGTKVLEQP
jgi:peptidylprolyl isomerase